MKTTGELVETYRDLLRNREAASSKAFFGKLLIIAGSEGMAGAAYLAGLAAFRTGMGMERFYGPECNRSILQCLLPEAMFTTYHAGLADAVRWADHIICGPGLSVSSEAAQVVRELMETDLSDQKLVLLDADALNLAAAGTISLRMLSDQCRRKSGGSTLVITPHVGEMSRLTGRSIQEIKEEPGRFAANYALEMGCTVVLKDHQTFISDPQGGIWKNNSGCAALAKAGSGDVLTGVIAGTCAITHAGAAAGAALGTYIHGKAGEKAAEMYGFHGTLARDVANAVSMIMQLL